jgi:hypothetical protein
MPAAQQFKELSAELRDILVGQYDPWTKAQFAEDNLREFLAEDEKAAHAYLDYLVTLTEAAFGRRRGDPAIDAWSAGIVIVSTPRDIVLEAIVPHMRPGGRLEGILEHGDRDLRQYVEYNSGTPVRSIHAYMVYFSRHSYDDAPHLIEYLYQAHPRAGFIGLVELRESMRDQSAVIRNYYELWSAILHLNDLPAGGLSLEAQAALVSLSSHPEWWIRMYVAELMRQHPELRQDLLVEKLADDPNPQIRDLINGFRQKKEE